MDMTMMHKLSGDLVTPVDGFKAVELISQLEVVKESMQILEKDVRECKHEWEMQPWDNLKKIYCEEAKERLERWRKREKELKARIKYIKRLQPEVKAAIRKISRLNQKVENILMQIGRHQKEVKVCLDELKALRAEHDTLVHKIRETSLDSHLINRLKATRHAAERDIPTWLRKFASELHW